MHAVYQEGAEPSAGDRMTITGDEAAHALRVKRVRVGERVLVLNGAGGAWLARVEEARAALALRIEERQPIEPVIPAVQVFAAAPKGPRAGDMVDLLSQVGAESWTLLAADRAGGGATAQRMNRLERVAQAACKQCRRAWTLRLDGPASLEAALSAEAGERVVLADGAAPAYVASGAARVRLLVGPEGGWSDAERRRARDAGATLASFGPHVMRIEAAAAVAVAIVIHAEGARLADAKSGG